MRHKRRLALALLLLALLAILVLGAIGWRGQFRRAPDEAVQPAAAGMA